MYQAIHSLRWYLMHIFVGTRKSTHVLMFPQHLKKISISLCWPYPYEYKVLMITNTNVIYAWVCCSNGLSNVAWNTLQMVGQSYSRTGSRTDPQEKMIQESRTAQGSGRQSVCIASCIFTRCPVDSTRVLVWYRFYFLRFLLICHWESLNLTYTLK